MKTHYLYEFKGLHTTNSEYQNSQRNFHENFKVEMEGMEYRCSLAVMNSVNVTGASYSHIHHQYSRGPIVVVAYSNNLPGSISEEMPSEHTEKYDLVISLFNVNQKEKEIIHSIVKKILG